MISKISQSQVLQRECELMLLSQETDELEDRLADQVESINCVALNDPGSMYQLQEVGDVNNFEDDKIRAQLEVVNDQHR